MKHILMVDDNTTNLKSAAEVLQPFYHLSMAKSGKQALNFLKKNRPDLILMDIFMPEMDGYEAVEQIKLNPKTANIPVIFLTADNEHESEVRGIQMGALDFITKPFEAQAMLGRIEKVLQMEDMRKSILLGNKRDILTDLWKNDYLSQEINKRLKFTDRNAVMMYINIDGFKDFRKINGYSNADGVVMSIANVLKNQSTPDSMLGRSDDGGFLVYMPYDLSDEEILSFCEELKNYVTTKANEASAGGVKLTVSLSGVRAPVNGSDFDTLYSKLRMAMYYLRCTGGDDIHFYVEE